MDARPTLPWQLACLSLVLITLQGVLCYGLARQNLPGAFRDLWQAFDIQTSSWTLWVSRYDWLIPALCSLGWVISLWRRQAMGWLSLLALLGLLSVLAALYGPALWLPL